MTTRVSTEVIVEHRMGVRKTGPSGFFPSFACLGQGGKPKLAAVWPQFSHRRPIGPRDPASGRPDSTGNQSIGIHCNGTHTIPMECIRGGMDWHPMHWSPLHTNVVHSGQGAFPTPASGKGQTRPDMLSLQFWQRHQSPEVIAMPQCVACYADLEPPPAHPTQSA